MSPSIHIDLEDGFVGDEVVVRVDGRKVYDRSTSTRYQIGLAATIEVEVTADSVQIEVALPQRRIRRDLHVDTTATPYIGVSLSPEGSIQERVSTEPFPRL